MSAFLLLAFSFGAYHKYQQAVQNNHLLSFIIGLLLMGVGLASLLSLAAFRDIFRLFDDDPPT
jgi:EamA domain-containing membrane protein RarD